MEQKKTKIFLVDDNQHFRQAVKEFLEGNGNFEVIGEASNGETFLKLVENLEPAVILMDLVMPIMDGISASKTRLKNKPNDKIIALSMYSDTLYVKQIAEAGFSGYVMKENVFKEIFNAIETVLRNDFFFFNSDCKDNVNFNPNFLTL